MEVQDAEFYVTNRLEVPWPFGQSTVALCVPCVINFGIQMGEALQAAMAEMAAAETPEGPGVLEQMEAAEKQDSGRPKRSRQSKSTATLQSLAETPAEKTEATDE
jgi:hypothetical protein